MSKLAVEVLSQASGLNFEHGHHTLVINQRVHRLSVIVRLHEIEMLLVLAALVHLVFISGCFRVLTINFTSEILSNQKFELLGALLCGEDRVSLTPLFCSLHIYLAEYLKQALGLCATILQNLIQVEAILVRQLGLDDTTRGIIVFNAKIFLIFKLVACVLREHPLRKLVRELSLVRIQHRPQLHRVDSLLPQHV